MIEEDIVSKIISKLLDYTGKVNIDFTSFGICRLSFGKDKTVKLCLDGDNIKISDIRCDHDLSCFDFSYDLTGCDIIISIEDFLNEDVSTLLDNIFNELILADRLHLPNSGIGKIMSLLRVKDYYTLNNFRIDFLSKLKPGRWTQRELCISTFSSYVAINSDVSGISTIYSKIYMKDFIEENIDGNIKVSIDSFDRSCSKFVTSCRYDVPIDDVNNGILGVNLSDIINFLNSIKKIRLD